MLTKIEIQAEGIVHDSVPGGERASTYDATVGTIIYEGKVVTEGKFTLDPRGVVWVVSAEEIETKENHTALATLKTSWAHQGVFALNVGIIDPGWCGPVATALVNFSNESFELQSGMSFLRLVFFKHAPTGVKTSKQVRATYETEIKRKARGFTKSFLNMHTLIKEVENEVFKLPKWAIYGAWGGLIVAIVAIFVPIAFSVYVSSQDQQVKTAQLQRRVDDLETKLKETTANVKTASNDMVKEIDSVDGLQIKPVQKKHKQKSHIEEAKQNDRPTNQR